MQGFGNAVADAYEGILAFWIGVALLLIALGYFIGKYHGEKDAKCTYAWAQTKTPADTLRVIRSGCVDGGPDAR